MAIDPLLIPIVVPTAVAFSIAAAVIFKGPLGEALATRLAGRASDASAGDADQLHADVDELRARIAEVEERLDFTERMLAQQPRDRALPPEA